MISETDMSGGIIFMSSINLPLMSLMHLIMKNIKRMDLK